MKIKIFIQINRAGKNFERIEYYYMKKSLEAGDTLVIKDLKDPALYPYLLKAVTDECCTCDYLIMHGLPCSRNTLYRYKKKHPT